MILPLIAGIIVAYYFQTQAFLNFINIALPILLATAAVVNILYKPLQGWKFRAYISSFYYLTTFSLGVFICLHNTNLLNANYFAKTKFEQLKVWVANEPQQSGNILRFEANVTNGYQQLHGTKATGKLLVALKLDSILPIHLKYGDELLISAYHEEVEPPYNPAEFNFKQWLASKNIYQQTFIRQEQLAKTGKNIGDPIIAYALTLRKRQIDTYRKLIKNDEAFAVASTLILGYRADLSAETLSAYSKTGTIHALSVSGMHVGIIYIMLNWLLSVLDKRKATKIIKVLLICSLIWGYSLLTGFSPSVLRAAVMLTVYILAKMSKRSTNGYNILAFTAFTLLIINPFYIWDVGFQLSFIAVFGLIYLQPKIYAWWYTKNKVLDTIWSTVALSLAAQLVALPLSVYYFHQFPVYFIISNLFILIPITILMYAGLAILVLKAHFIAPAFEWLINFMNAGLKWIASLPFASLSSIWIDGMQLALLSVFIGLITYGFSYRNKKPILYSLVTLLVFCCSISFDRIKNINQKKIIFFSLRKNYASAFITANSAILFTDLKETEKNYLFFVKPALDNLGITNVKFVKWQDNAVAPSFIKNNNQINYRGKTFLLVDSTFNYKQILNLPTYNYVWMHNNPKVKLTNLVNEVNTKTLILDASNKDYLLRNFEQQLSELKISAYTLKKKKSVILNID